MGEWNLKNWREAKNYRVLNDLVGLTGVFLARVGSGGFPEAVFD